VESQSIVRARAIRVKGNMNRVSIATAASW
jgi:hypothetical protein